MRIPQFAKMWWDRILLTAKVLWEKMLHQEATPSQIAQGFALGVFVCFLPIIPFQTVVGLCLAYYFRSNKVALLTGLHIHMLVLPLYLLAFPLELKIGQMLLHFRGKIKSGELEKKGIMYLIHKGPAWIGAMMLGALFIGIPTAIISYFVVKAAAQRWQKLKIAKDTIKQINP